MEGSKGLDFANVRNPTLFYWDEKCSGLIDQFLQIYLFSKNNHFPFNKNYPMQWDKKF